MPKITREKLRDLEETATAVLEGKASLFIPATKKQLAAEAKKAAVEKDLEEKGLSVRKIAERRGLNLRAVARISAARSHELGSSRRTRVGVAPRRTKSPTGVFSEEEAKRIIQGKMALINYRVNDFLRGNPWILNHYSRGEILDFVTGQLEHQFLTLDPKYVPLKSRPSEIGKFLNHSVSRFILPGFRMRAARKFANGRREIPESQIGNGEGEFAALITARHEKKPYSFSVRKIKERMRKKGIPPITQVLLLARLAGMNNSVTARFLGVSRARVTKLLAAEKAKLGIGLFENIRQARGVFARKRAKRKPA